MTTSILLDDKTSRNENQSNFLYQTNQKSNKNITPQFNSCSTSINSPYSEKFRSENYYVSSFSAYDTEILNNDDENFSNEIFSKFQSKINFCDFLFIQKKRPFAEDKKLIYQKSNRINEKDNTITIEIINDFDKLTIETETKNKRKREKILEIKKEIIKKRSDFSIFEKPFGFI